MCYSDNCPGKNKNFTLMASFHRINLLNKKDIELNFPVRWHSYLPSDIALGVIERAFKNKVTMFTDKEVKKILG